MNGDALARRVSEALKATLGSVSIGADWMANGTCLLTVRKGNTYGFDIAYALREAFPDYDIREREYYAQIRMTEDGLRT